MGSQWFDLASTASLAVPMSPGRAKRDNIMDNKTIETPAELSAACREFAARILANRWHPDLVTYYFGATFEAGRACATAASAAQALNDLAWALMPESERVARVSASGIATINDDSAEAAQEAVSRG